MKKVVLSNKDTLYELFTSGDQSAGVFEEVVFACHTDTAVKILRTTTVDQELMDLVASVEYADNVIYLHSDPKLMPARRRAWSSWNCLGKSELLSSYKVKNSKAKESFEGGESGFGNKISGSKADGNDHEQESALEGKNGRMKAVYV
eukprot:CAMPEP_0176036042 /NCGR_PEP_ID=MMETSP0120_2-20121206/17847_1 /TAXON_ID=160619 /ORGANISM="Kryptoperidinium foliaceum, Strain CCMP 1326" /LENGTH=146 /DNA_ID=CAMNT_0017369427 /DNA_START=110 /DNA_END=546 /DNA_ORIENTATION=-